MELSLIGLQNAGKTSLVNVIAVSKLFMRGVNFFFKVSFPLFWFDADGKISVFGTYFQTGGYSEDMIPTVCHSSSFLLEFLFASNFCHTKMSISPKTFHCIATSFCLIIFLDISL
jgi:hypothetical protein